MLRCPRCKAEQTFELEVISRDAREIREGELTCRSCRQQYVINRGIVDLLYDPPDFVKREAGGLARFAERMRRDGWNKERILSLPYLDDGYWFVQAVSMNQILERIQFRHGERLLDVGANTCWASNIFAKRGLDVVALDITDVEMQGLITAEYFLESNTVYFERVLGTMFDPPLASDKLDYVFCCEVLHHNDSITLRRTFNEFYRVLKPRGRLIVINETMKFPLNLKPSFANHVREYLGYEHVFYFHEYYLAAKKAGFKVSVMEPAYDPFFRDLSSASAKTLTDEVKLIVAKSLRNYRLARSLYLAYRNLLAGDVGLNLICTKA